MLSEVSLIYKSMVYILVSMKMHRFYAVISFFSFKQIVLTCERLLKLTASLSLPPLTRTLWLLVILHWRPGAESASSAGGGLVVSSEMTSCLLLEHDSDGSCSFNDVSEEDHSDWRFLVDWRPWFQLCERIRLSVPACRLHLPDRNCASFLLKKENSPLSGLFKFMFNTFSPCRRFGKVDDFCFLKASSWLVSVILLSFVSVTITITFYHFFSWKHKRFD